MPDLLDQYLAGEKKKEPDLLEQYLATKPIKEEVPPKEPTFWEKAWGTVTEAPSNLKEAFLKLDEYTYYEPLDVSKWIPKATEALGNTWTWAVRFLPGNEDLPDWEDQTEGQKIWTSTQATAMVGAVTEAIRQGISVPKAIRASGRMKRIAKMPTTRAEALKEASKKVEITRGFAVKEPEVRLKPIKPAAGAPSITREVTAELHAIKPAILKTVKTLQFKDTIHKQLYDLVSKYKPSPTSVDMEPFYKTADALTGTPLKGLINPAYGEVTYNQINKVLPFMLNQFVTSGKATAQIKEVIPEEQIVDTEIGRKLTPTPEEYAAPEVAPKAEFGFKPRDIAYLKGQTVEGLANNKHIWEDAKTLGYDKILTLKNKKILELTNDELETLSAWAMDWEMTPYTERAGRTLDAAVVDIKTARGLYGKPEVAPKVEIPEVKPEVLAEEITREVKPPTKPPIPPTPPPREMPEFAGEPVGDPVAKLNELIKAAKPLRKKLEKAYTAERGKRIAEVDKFIQETIDTVGGEEGYKMILSKLKGELAPPEMKVAFEPLKDELTAEELKSLYIRTWKHPYLDNWEKVSAADGLTNLLMGGIPQPKKLVLLEEIYGSELVKNILSKRVWGAKATDFLVEAANVPRALLATADMSAFLRQGVIELAAHPVISAKAIGKTFEFAFSPKSFEQYFVDLRKDPLYPLMRKSGLSITDPSRAGMQEREEAFISRFLQKIPIVKIPVEFAERSYVGFLNKLRVDIFKVWADELLSKGHTPTKDPELFKSAADVVNTFTGRGSLGKAGNKITPQLNTLFFSPRLIAARFNALNPVWYAKQPKEIRKKAIGDVAKFVAAGLAVLALVKTYKEATGASEEEISVETDTRSSDSGKIRVGNTRFDIWGGFQQWVRVFTQLITGERKNTKTGEIISLTKDEYPFTTRKEVLLRFMEGKLAPVPQLINELISGAKTFGGEDITAGYITKSKFVPMYIQDIAEAYTDGGLGRAVGVSIPAFFGVGVQTWLPRKKKRKRRVTY